MPRVYPKPSPAAVEVDSSKKRKVQSPVRRGRSATADVNSSKKQKVQSKAQREPKSDVESEPNSSSESDSDPDEEVLPEDLLVHGVSVIDFECVRDASRSRVSDRTKTAVSAQSITPQHNISTADYAAQSVPAQHQSSAPDEGMYDLATRVSTF